MVPTPHTHTAGWRKQPHSALSEGSGWNGSRQQSAHRYADFSSLQSHSACSPLSLNREAGSLYSIPGQVMGRETGTSEISLGGKSWPWRSPPCGAGRMFPPMVGGHCSFLAVGLHHLYLRQRGGRTAVGVSVCVGASLYMVIHELCHGGGGERLLMSSRKLCVCGGGAAGQAFSLPSRKLCSSAADLFLFSWSQHTQPLSLFLFLR